MSSPKSVNQKSLQRNINPSPVKDFDKSYDSRESVNDQEERANVTPQQVTKNVRYEQSAPQNTEEPLFENKEELQKVGAANLLQVKEDKEKKKKRKVKKTDETLESAASDGTATFPKVSTERKAQFTDDNETNQGEVVKADTTDNASAETKPKSKKKKVAEDPKAVTQSNAASTEEKPKKVQKKVAEKKEEVVEPNVQVVENKSVDNSVASTQQKSKPAKKIQKVEEPAVVEPTVQKASKNTQEVAVNISTDTKQKINKQELENKKPQSKQGNRNLQVVDPAETKPSLIKALVSPANVSGKTNISKQNNVSATPKATETEPRYSKNTQKDEDFGPWSTKEKTGNNTLKKSPTQEELSIVSSPKSKLGPIRSKIETGLGNVRASSKRGDTSEISGVSPIASNNRAKSPDAAFKQRGTTFGQKSQGDVSAMHKSHILERVSTHTEMKKKKKENPRMRSFDAGKTEKISAEDTFETRSKVWQIRKAEKLLEEEKKRTRKQLEQCTFAPTVNKRVLPPELSTSNVYERSVEWSEKVKSAIVAKGEEIYETKTKPNPKKPRMKSFGGPSHDFRSSRIELEGFTGPQFGVSKNVPAFSQEPLEFKGNLEEKVGEICSVYENIASVLKKKSVNNASKSSIKEKPISRNESVKTVSRVSTATHKERPAKADLSATTIGSPTDDKRITSLRGILNIGSKDKKKQNEVTQGEAQKYQQEHITHSPDNTDRIVPKPNQRVEIRNNRYVIIDDDEISAIEKNENDGNHDVSVNFDASTVTAQQIV